MMLEKDMDLEEDEEEGEGEEGEEGEEKVWKPTCFQFSISPPPFFPADAEMLLGGVLWGRGEGFPVGLELVLLYMTFCKSRAD